MIVPKKIKITVCDACGKQFENLKPNSIHEVVKSPRKDMPNGYEGSVWVMGIGEPVRVLSREWMPCQD